MFPRTHRGVSARGRRRAALGVSAALAALALAGCSDAGATDANADGGDEGLKVGVIMLQGDTYYQGIESGLKAAVEADGGSVVTGLSNNDPATEAQVAQNMIQAKVDAILMQPAAADASLATMKSIQDAGITLICYGNCTDAALEPGNSSGVIQSDNTALGTGTGEVAAQYINDNLDGKANIAILNCDIASACKLRKAGFKEALEAAGVEANYVTDQEAYLADKATTVATDILTAHDDIDLIWASNDGGTVGATVAVKQAGKDVKVFGTDISAQLAEQLLADDDILQVTTGQDPVATAQGAYEMAKKAIDGEENDPFAVELPGIVYNRAEPANVEEFLASAQ
ncbi:MAG TPA: substrate-binding domain-containing protein [Nocardioidaceae bacterium]|nr:substrate-binding domain-containing protein [Nocardioidaceae bacterium]